MILLAAIYGGLRNFEGFHGMAYHAQATAALSLVLGMGITSRYAQKRSGAGGAGPSGGGRRGGVGLLIRRFCGLGRI